MTCKKRFEVEESAEFLTISVVCGAYKRGGAFKKASTGKRGTFRHIYDGNVVINLRYPTIVC